MKDCTQKYGLWLRRMGMVAAVALILMVSACSAAHGAQGNTRGFVDFETTEGTYLERIHQLQWPEGYALPQSLEGEDEGASYQKTFGDTLASNLWEAAWMREWLDAREVDPERARAALEELEKAFDMAYLGPDRADDATRNHLREVLEGAREGDPSGILEYLGEEAAQ
ncbi:MAG: hypothetical protein Q4E76_02570 [Tissierellia bacterium]|nr:hypothetical protein [Tissierellia bacterium]